MNSTTSLNGLQNGENPSTAVAQARAPDVTASTDSGGDEPSKSNVVHSVTGMKLDAMNDSNQIKIKNQIQPNVQLCTEDNKKIVISGAKSVQDIPVNVLQQILSNVKNVKSSEAVLVINHNKQSINSTDVKSYESIVKDAVGVDALKSNDNHLENAPPDNAKELRNDCSINSTSSDSSKNNATVAQINSQIDCIISNNLKIRNDDTKILICNVDAIINKKKEEKCEQEKLTKLSLPPKTQPVKPPKSDSKQKKFLYRLKSKNGKILSYVSETPIILKKPVIRLQKMTQADAEKLSRKFAEESKRKTKRTPKVSNSKVDLTENDENLTSQQSYGVQTRKRQLKFLPDGRMVKGKKSKLGSSASSLSSLDDDDEDRTKPVVTSDEDYIENLDASSDEDVKIISYKPGTKKVTPPKNLSVENKRTVDSKTDIKNNSKAFCDEEGYPKVVTPSVNIQPNKTPSTTPILKKTSIEPATVFSSLLRIPILPSQLSVRRFKPKILILENNKTTTPSFLYKKIFTPDNPLTKASNVMRINTSLPNSCTTPRSTNNTSGLNSSTLNNHGIWRNTQPKVDYRTPSTHPPPLAPISQKTTSASKNVNHTFAKKTIGNHVQHHTILDISSKFEGFTNTKIVKTKAGPKKAILEEIKKSEEPRTIYEIMEEIFDSMPHWNIHVIPENKSFCLAQISLGRTGIPILKKSIEINSEFMAKVYVHQLHCKRYDGIYDTESKIRKLISDVERLAS